MAVSVVATKPNGLPSRLEKHKRQCIWVDCIMLTKLSCAAWFDVHIPGEGIAHARLGIYELCECKNIGNCFR